MVLVYFFIFHYSIAGLAQLEERLMNEVHEMWDKGEERENNKQKGNNHEKEKKVEEKRRTKVEEIGRLVSVLQCRFCMSVMLFMHYRLFAVSVLLFTIA